jgi:hypothetical protein
MALERIGCLLASQKVPSILRNTEVIAFESRGHRRPTRNLLDELTSLQAPHAAVKP